VTATTQVFGSVEKRLRDIIIRLLAQSSRQLTPGMLSEALRKEFPWLNGPSGETSGR
jgi:hypothetical protein